MFQGLKSELKKLWHNKMLTITVIVMLFIPILYAGIFLKGVWDPYGNLGNIKVAIVNNDQPVQYNGATLNVGKQVIDTIKKDKTFDWQIMSSSAAKQCLHDDKCYMVVTLPQDFSKKAATVTNITPEQMELKYETNGSLNYPLETIGGSAAKQLRSQISEQVTLAYANAVLNSIKQTGNQIQTAADGSRQITNGLADADNGVSKMQSQMPTLQSGVNQLTNGAGQLDNGVGQLVDQTKASAATLQNALPDVKKLNDGAHQLSDGLKQINSYQPQLAELQKDIDRFQKELDRASSITSSQEYKDLVNKLSNLDDKDKDLLHKLGFNDQQIAVLADKLQQLPKTENLPDANELKNKVGTLSNGLNSLTAGSTQLADGTNTLYNQLTQMSNQLNSPKTLSQLNQLRSGSSQLTAGLSSLNGQTPTLANGVNQLKSGTSKLLAGSNTLTGSLQDGANQIKSTPLSDKTATQMASPVKATQQKYSNVKNYGHGLAPYFMAVSLFVGCMVFNFAYPVRKIANTRQGWFAWFSAKFIVGAVAATAMATITGGIMMALGLEVQHPAQYFSILILHANAVMFLIMFLAIAFDNPGRFIAMLVLIFSLGAAAGTFPIETSGAFYQWIHPLLPMSYTITGLRESISSGISQTNFTQCFAVLIGVLIANIALLALNMFILRKWKGTRAGHSVVDGKDKLLAEM